MTNKLYFATTNENKIAEATKILGVEIEGSGLAIDEIQSLDPIEVAHKKAQAYYDVLKKPIFVEDSTLTFEALKGLPGTYINDFLKALDNEGLCKLIKNESNRKATAGVTLVLIDESGQWHEFTGETKGEIAQEPLGDNGFGWDAIFVPEGDTRTFAQMTQDEKLQYSMRARAFEKMKIWLENNK